MNEEHEKINAINSEQSNKQEEPTKQQSIALSSSSNVNNSSSENERKIKIIPFVNKQPVTTTIKLTNESMPMESSSSLPTTKLITLTNSAGSGLLSSSKLSSASGIQYVKVVNTSSLNKNSTTNDFTRPNTATVSLNSNVKLHPVNSNTNTNNSILADALNVLAKNTTSAQSTSIAPSTSTTGATKYQIINPTASKLNQALNQIDHSNPVRTMSSASPATTAFSQRLVSTAPSGNNSTTTTTTSVTKIILNASSIKPHVPLTNVNLTPVVNQQQQQQTANPVSNYKILSQQINSNSPTIKPIISTIAPTITTTMSTGLKASLNNQILVTKPLNEEKKAQLTAVSLTPIASSNSKQLTSNQNTTTTVLKSNSSITNTTSAFLKPQFQSKLLTTTTTTPVISSVNKTSTESPLSVTLSQIPTSNSTNSTMPLTNTSNISLTNSNSATSTTSSNVASSSLNNRKPCNCTKSMCLKLYCDCFAIGSFCHDCNCFNCFNTLEHEEERNKAIKMILERNPQAFQSKIKKFTQVAQMNENEEKLSETLEKNHLVDENGIPITHSNVPSLVDDDLQSRHVKGCKCRKSNCLKRYCECFLADIQCSELCQCVGCKNCDELTRIKLDRRALSQNSSSDYNNLIINSNHQQQKGQSQFKSQKLLSHPSTSFKNKTSFSSSNMMSLHGSFDKHKQMNENYHAPYAASNLNDILLDTASNSICSIDNFLMNRFDSDEMRMEKNALNQTQSHHQRQILFTQDMLENAVSNLIDVVSFNFNKIEKETQMEIDQEELLHEQMNDLSLERFLINEFSSCLTKLISDITKPAQSDDILVLSSKN